MERGRPIWENGKEKQEQIRLEGCIQRDAVVIGGGMTGILTAYFLQQQGVRTAVLEADRIGGGQSGGSDRDSSKVFSYGMQPKMEPV